jgi:hypothetical protein
MERVLPHIDELLKTDLEASIRDTEVILVGKQVPELGELHRWLRADQVVIDLGRHGDFSPARVLRIV